MLPEAVVVYDYVEFTYDAPPPPPDYIYTHQYPASSFLDNDLENLHAVINRC